MRWITLLMSVLVLVSINHKAMAREITLQPSKQTTTTTTSLPKAITTIKLGTIITRVEHAGSCVKKNTLIIVKGQKFGSKNGKRVVFKDTTVHVHALTLSWSDTRITLRLPDDPKFKGGRKYYIGIETTAERWLSNTTKYVTVCRQLKATTFDPNLFSRRTQSLGEENENDDDGSGQISISAGRSIESELPPAPADLPPPPSKKDKTIEPREVMIVSTNMIEAQKIAQQAKRFGFRIKRRTALKGLGMVVSVISVPKGVSMKNGLSMLRRTVPKTEQWKIGVNHRYVLQGKPSTKQYGSKLIGWRSHSSTCGRGIRIGLIDTALDMAHPSLRGQSITTRSFLTAGIPSAAPDHGTAVAALLVGKHTSAGIAGLLPGSKLYVANVFRQRGKRRVETTAEWIVLALDWLVRQRVHIINVSLGGPRNLLLETAIKRVLARGVVVIAAAGNNGPGGRPVYPAAHKGVIAVTAVDARLNPYRKANRGRHISFSAPGVDVWTAKPGGKFVYVSGTSYAVPFVATVFAGARLANPRRSWPTITKNLQKKARDLGQAGKDPIFGWGLVQASGSCSEAVRKKR
ncbi:MAG: S8 family serine peptidase [Acidiferrobacterales bacterium]